MEFVKITVQKQPVMPVIWDKATDKVFPAKFYVKDCCNCDELVFDTQEELEKYLLQCEDTNQVTAYLGVPVKISLEVKTVIGG